LGDLAEGWSGEDAYERLQEARELDREVGEAREAVRQAEDSLRLNPRRRLVGDPSDELREAMSTLEHSVILIRGLCRSLVDLDMVTGGRGPDPELRAAIGRLLGAVADAVRTFGDHVAARSAQDRDCHERPNHDLLNNGFAPASRHVIH